MNKNIMQIKKDVNFEYMNGSGVVFDDCFIFFNLKMNCPFSINETKEVVLEKKRNYILNIVVISLAFFLGLLTYINFNISSLFLPKVIVLGLIIILLIFALFFKQFKYTLIVSQKYRVLEIIVRNKDKDETKLIVQKINSKLKRHKKQEVEVLDKIAI